MQAERTARGTYEVDAALWAKRGEALLEEALAEARDNTDPLATISAAETAFRIEQGELPPDTMDGFPFPGEDENLPCICPPELLARGGFKGGCPTHG